MQLRSVHVTKNQVAWRCVLSPAVAALLDMRAGAVGTWTCYFEDSQ